MESRQAKIVLLKGDHQIPDQDLGEEGISIGREKDNRLKIDHESVSRHHARIYADRRGFQVMDLDSRNFTYLNGQRLPANTPYRLRHSDTIKICGYIFEFRDDDEDSPSRDSSNDSVILVDARSSQETWSVELDSSLGRWQHRAGADSKTHLKALMELTRRLQGMMDRDEVFDTVLAAMLSLFPEFDVAFAALMEPGAVQPSRSRVRRRGSARGEPLLSRTVIQDVMEKQKAIASARLQLDYPNSESIASANVGSFMCAPLVGIQGNSFGVLQIESRGPRSQDVEAELAVFSTVAAYVAQVLENLTLYDLEMERRRIRDELAFARQIQFGLLPQKVPEIPGYTVSDYYSPMQQVGGDYYTYVALHDGRWAIVVADVEGHGIPAALLVSKLASEVHSLFARGHSELEVLQEINRSIVASSVAKFVTMAIVVVDPLQHTLSVANAGHVRPVVRTATGNVAEIGDEQAGFMLGFADDVEAAAYSRPVRPGDLLVAYTDGLTDAENAAGDVFGRQRFVEALAQANGTAEQAQQRVVAAVTGFMEGRPPTDDMCMICLRREPNG